MVNCISPKLLTVFLLGVFTAMRAGLFAEVIFFGFLGEIFAFLKYGQLYWYNTHTSSDTGTSSDSLNIRVNVSFNCSIGRAWLPEDNS